MSYIRNSMSRIGHAQRKGDFVTAANTELGGSRRHGCDANIHGDLRQDSQHCQHPAIHVSNCRHQPRHGSGEQLYEAPTMHAGTGLLRVTRLRQVADREGTCGVAKQFTG